MPYSIFTPSSTNSHNPTLDSKSLPEKGFSQDTPSFFLDAWLQSKALPWILIGLGIFLRFKHYLSNRSLWLDEAMLTLNIQSRSFEQLLQPLDYKQGAPVGFLFIEKLAILLFGNNEYALRLFPFVCGILALFLFYRVAQAFIRPKAVPITLALFVICDSLIYFSAEVKQYSSDVTIALLLYLVASHYLEREYLTFQQTVFCALIGALAVWFSHPAVFILAGIGLTFIFSCVRRKHWQKLGWILAIGSLSLISFFILYSLSLQDLANHKELVDSWEIAFMPFPPTSFWDIWWFVNAFFKTFAYPVGLPLSGVAALAFLIGSYFLFLENKEKLLLLVIPILFTGLASGLYKYPFHGRLLLFLLPSFLLLVAEGVEQIWERTKMSVPILGIIVLGLLFLHPVLLVVPRLVYPHTQEEIKPVLSYIQEHKQAGDLLYIYYPAQYAFRYYAERYGFHPDDYIIGSQHLENNYQQDLAKIQGHKRIWFLFSHVIRRNIAAKELLLQQLDTAGSRLDFFQRKGVEAYLYAFP